MVTIRKAAPDDVDGIARVHVETWRTTYTGLMPDEMLASLSVERRADMWRRTLTEYTAQSYVYVAEDENGETVGFVAGGQERTGHELYKGEVYAIYVLKSVQGKGVGRELMQFLVQRFLDEGYTSMMLWVLRDNLGSRAFYERMGGEYVAEKTEEFGGATLVEVAYGWSDIQGILDAPV